MQTRLSGGDHVAPERGLLVVLADELDLHIAGLRHRGRDVDAAGRLAAIARLAELDRVEEKERADTGGPGPCRHSRVNVGNNPAHLHEALVRGNLARHVMRSEEHTSELQSLMRISYAVFCLKKKTQNKTQR